MFSFVFSSDDYFVSIRGWFELHALPQGNPDPSQRNGEGGCFGTNQAIKATALVKVLEK